MARLNSPLATAAGIALLALGSQAQAAISTTPIIGSLGPTQETCLQGLTTSVGDGENCMYDGGPSSVASAVPVGEITGPYNQIAYYDSLATPAAFQQTASGLGVNLYAPVVGDGKISQVINGSVSVNDNGDGFGANDLISFTMTLTSPGGGSIVRSYGSSVVDKYDSMTQTLAPVVANFVTANGSGGFDYLIGSEGFPSLLTYSQAGPDFGKPFGSVEGGHSFNTPTIEPDFWNGTSAAGIGSLENNLGAKTTGTVTNLQCIDSINTATGVDSNDCQDSQVSYAPYLGANGPCLITNCVVGGTRGASEDVGWDQLLLKVSTDASGNVLSLAGFNVDDYRVFGLATCGDNSVNNNPCNSWTSGYFTASAVPAPAGVWLLGTGLVALAGRRLRRGKTAA